MIMSGRLGEWSVADLLQIARITQKTTSIEVVGESRAGVIYLREGRIVDAFANDPSEAAGDRMSRIIGAVLALSSIRDGTFEFGTRDVPLGERPIDVKVVLDAIEKDLAREKRLAELGMTDDERFGASPVVGAPVTLQPVAWALLTQLITPFTLTELEARVGRRKAVATVLMLDGAGVLARGVDEPADHPADQDHPSVAVSGEDWERAGAQPEASETAVDTSSSERDSHSAGSGPPSPEERAGPSELAGPIVEAFDQPVPPGPVSGDAPFVEIFDQPMLPVPRLGDAPIVEIFEDSAASDSGRAALPAPEATVELDEPDPTLEVAESDVRPPRPWEESPGPSVGVPQPAETLEMSGPDMHEVVIPSDTTLVSDVLSDLRSRFRSGKNVTNEPDDDD
jgi:hypothetical protein